MVKHAHQLQGKRTVPCESCPPGLARHIDHQLNRCKVLATQGLWTEAAAVFAQLREAALELQPCTVDPYEVPIADTSILAQTRDQLEAINVRYLGQLANVPRHVFERLRIGRVGMREMQRVCKNFGVHLR